MRSCLLSVAQPEGEGGSAGMPQEGSLCFTKPAHAGQDSPCPLVLSGSGRVWKPGCAMQSQSGAGGGGRCKAGASTSLPPSGPGPDGMCLLDQKCSAEPPVACAATDSEEGQPRRVWSDQVRYAVGRCGRCPATLCEGRKRNAVLGRRPGPYRGGACLWRAVGWASSSG